MYILFRSKTKDIHSRHEICFLLSYDMKYDVLFKTTKMALNTLFLADQISDEHAV